MTIFLILFSALPLLIRMVEPATILNDDDDAVLKEVLRPNCTIVKILNGYNGKERDNDDGSGQTYLRFSTRETAARYAVRYSIFYKDVSYLHDLTIFRIL